MQNGMNGLEIARRFFDEWGLPYLRSEFPQISERVAGILFGGSQSLGNDDELSRDHGWGPGLTLILTAEDMRRFGQRLRKSLDRDAPREWVGQKWQYPDKNATIDSIDRWFRQNIGSVRPPWATKAWLQKGYQAWLQNTQESKLYMLRHASVFHDPLGEFTSRRKAFWYYPREVWLHRLLQEMFYVWHYGQYNFLERLTHRKDPIAISVCLGSFIQATMRLCMLLEEDYTPYWKWLASEFRKLPNVSDLEAKLSKLSVCNDLDGQMALVDAICKDIYSRLVDKGLVSANPTGHPHPLWCARMELLAKQKKD